MTAYLPFLAYLGVWLLAGALAALLRRALAGNARKTPPFAAPGGGEMETGDPWRPLARLAPAVSGAVLLLVLPAAGPEGAGGLLPMLLLVLVVAIALIHAGRRGGRPGSPESP